MKNKKLILTGLAFVALSASAQEYKEGYVDWGFGGTEFGTTVTNWKKGTPITEDDNFFISRVKPRERFRNANTQVRPNLNESNDKKLLFWVPINGTKNNALPDGVYDSEVFNMWPYVTHYGNWTAPLGRVPGNFLDVAHKNGVAVSGVAGIPYGSLYQFPAWETCLETLVDAGAQKVADFHHYYGVDGMGYNSEFGGGYYIQSILMPFHVEVNKIQKQRNPLFENVWYDGTNDNGQITFDQGLGSHNDQTFGHAGEEAANLFLNYNWNRSSLLSSSVSYANSIGRNPLDLYAGVNMQGAEPGTNNWPLLQQYPISIGLWGAHSENMFWESRGEKGSEPEVKQRTYQLRTERWFTGGTRNPANCPAVTNSMKYHADNVTYHGMSSFMTARSAMKWDLGEEALITYFNLGNGKYFNWNGVRQHDKEWYNIGSQDYLPTWRWWFTKSLLGTDVVAGGLNAEFTWDEAYVGGSSARVYGSTSAEYLHLFKTEYALKAGDVVTVRYKLKKGAADVKLVFTALGNEKVALGNYELVTAADEADEDVWVERQFTVGDELAGKTVALVALQFQNAKDMDLYLGEFSIVRGAAATPATPVVAKAALLSNSKYGVDGKIVFNMTNNKPAGEPCYNIDVKTAFFKIYAQQEGQQPVLMGFTSSWAALAYNIPMNLKAADRVRIGVSAVALDHKSESTIAWSQYMDAPAYVYDDNIQCNKNTIKPNESFEMSYIDPRHESATWKLVSVATGTEVFSGEGHTVTCDGLTETGSYDLHLTGVVRDEEGKTSTTTRTFGSFVQITSEGVGALPQIYTLTANDKEADIDVVTGEEIALAYTGRPADGAGSQGVDLKEKRFGVRAGDLDLQGKKDFSVSFWLKINKLAAGETQLLAVAYKLDAWPKTDWGWLWSNVDETGAMTSFTWRGTDRTNNNELRYKYDNTKLPIGNWVHIAYTFDYDDSGKFQGEFYVNGVKQERTRWNRQSNGDSYFKTDPGYQSDVYEITANQVISVGGAAHGRAGIDGTIDNFTIWNKALTADEVKTSMGDLQNYNLPASVLAFWGLEKEAAADYTFGAAGIKEGVKAGCHDYAATGAEGQGVFSWVESEYTSGCPFISGTAYPVTTLPTWKAKKGVVTESTGKDVAGTAKLSYAKAGDYEVTLTLANSLGQDQKTFRVIKVGVPEGIENAAGAELNAYTVDSQLFVELAEAGNYCINVYNAAGKLAATTAQQFNAGAKAQLTLHQKGVYVLSVEKDGKVVRTVKLLRK
jgi:endo-beta-N-acetylglucosaminidase D